MKPVWYTVDQSVISSGWEGAIKARIWRLGAELPHSPGAAHRHGRKQGEFRKHKLAQTLEIQVSWFSWEGPNSCVFSFILVLLNSVAIFSQL